MRAGEMSSVEVVTAFLERIDEVEPTIRAFISVDHERALAYAEQADARYAAGDPTGCLHGVPVGIKDNLWTSDLPTTSGSKLYESFTAPSDCISVERIRSAGGIVIGKTNMPEFAVWPRTVSLVREECLNPWNTAHVSGASSGGSGAAVAAAQVPLALGTDGGGSTRLPAAVNGLVGIQPSRGIVPSWGRVGGAAFSGIGPMTRTVQDNARLLTVISGADTRDPASIGTQWIDYEIGLHDHDDDLRLAWMPTMGDFAPNGPLTAVVRDAVDALAVAGVQVEEIPERFDGIAEMFFVLVIGAHPYGTAEAGPFQSEEVQAAAADPRREELLSPYILSSIEQLASIPRDAYDAGVAWLADAERRINDVFDRYDFIVCPTAPFVAPACPDDPWSLPWESMGEYVSNTGLANVLQITALTVPCGFLDGLPVGLQLIGPRASEFDALRVAHLLERVRPWAQARPSIG
jgi:Asp-tRNA(Asn)/Glu-tRNA(Gln) amidotransferase A subunit family amidase